MSDMDEVLAKVGKKTRDRAVAASDVHIEYLETPIASLNKAMGGGLPYGRQVMFYGNKSCGKSSILLQMIAKAQEQGKSCLWVDVEKTFDPDWAQRLGVDTEKLRVDQTSSIVKVADDVVEFLKAGIDIVVIDSISALVPMGYFEKDSEDLKSLDGTKAMGSLARDLATAIGMWNEANDNTLLILISQLRNKLGQTYVSLIPTGGNAPMFFSSTVLRLMSSPSINEAKKGKLQLGDYVYETPIGREVNWTLENSKTSQPMQTGTYDFYFAGDFVGADGLGDVIDSAIRYGFITKSGAWFAYGDLKWQGRDKVVAHFRSLPDDYEILKKEVMEYGNE